MPIIDVVERVVSVRKRIRITPGKAHRDRKHDDEGIDQRFELSAITMYTRTSARIVANSSPSKRLSLLLNLAGQPDAEAGGELILAKPASRSTAKAPRSRSTGLAVRWTTR